MYICGQLIFDKGAKAIQCGKDSLSNKCWKFLHDTKNIIQKEKKDKLHIIKIKNFCSIKDTIKEWKQKKKKKKNESTSYRLAGNISK
jgi:hypothetical protein